MLLKNIIRTDINIALILKHDVEFWEVMNATYNITGKLASVSALVNTILEFGGSEHYAKVVHFRNKM